MESENPMPHRALTLPPQAADVSDLDRGLDLFMARRHLSDPTVFVIEARRPGTVERLRELWAYRRLTAYFARRYIQKGYQRTWLGWIWIPLRPVLSIAPRVLVFGGLLGAPSGRVPYLVFFLVGTSAWELFERTAYWATRSIELNRRVLTRLYVPRLTALVAAVAPSGLNFLLYLALTLSAGLYYAIADSHWYLVFGVRTLVALAGLVLVVLLGLGIGLWAAPYGAQARDVRFTLRYVLSFWYFLTPVIYPLSAVPERFRGIAGVNPMTAPMEMARYGLLGQGEIPRTALLVTLGTIAVVVLGGLRQFGRAEAAAIDSL
jgi:lipopolysaccharide transport system permease protein